MPQSLSLIMPPEASPERLVSCLPDSLRSFLTSGESDVEGFQLHGPEYDWYVEHQDAPVSAGVGLRRPGDGYVLPLGPSSAAELQRMRRGSHIWYVHVSEASEPELRAIAVEEYQEHEALPPELRASLESCHFYACNFSDVNVVRWVLLELFPVLPFELRSLWVHDDYGRLLRGDTFLAQLRSEQWDWRHA
ncbi:hypothetical protein FGE12_25470 [Aggregicoccus sp. 17bor-14]|uniref:hypothetical protein n=1 Tax=Myxococcaceae TaxID=31 RepID=UPI00129C7EB0|nr:MULTISPECIES: hypothetical protein [Myxococcaceae]MBF5045783.1 hypothetical protein [Simulacricoccus sp. 17bor-14]MRI91518.1 hypothetical protein [Aggregicoccus sp. 17bor-14]